MKDIIKNDNLDIFIITLYKYNPPTISKSAPPGNTPCYTMRPGDGHNGSIITPELFIPQYRHPRLAAVSARAPVAGEGHHR